MSDLSEKDLEYTMTPRRANRELYARFLLDRAKVDFESAEAFMITPQAVLNNESPLTLIYTGRGDAAISAVEAFTDDLTIEDL